MRVRLTLLGLLAYASAAWASEIRLTDGFVHRDVTILNRDEANLQVKASNGIITLPIAEVEAMSVGKRQA